MQSELGPKRGQHLCSKCNKIFRKASHATNTVLCCTTSSHHLLLAVVGNKRLTCFEYILCVYARQLSWDQFQVFEMFCPVMCCHGDCLKVKQTLCPCFLQKRISRCEMLIMLFTWSKYMSRLLKEVFLAKSK